MLFVANLNKKIDDKTRHPKMRNLVRKAGSQLIRRRFSNIPELTAYELPRDAVVEAIVNALAHSDYASNASVRVMLFAEIWNLGEHAL